MITSIEPEVAAPVFDYEVRRDISSDNARSSGSR